MEQDNISSLDLTKQGIKFDINTLRRKCDTFENSVLPHIMDSISVMTYIIDRIKSNIEYIEQEQNKKSIEPTLTQTAPSHASQTAAQAMPHNIIDLPLRRTTIAFDPSSANHVILFTCDVKWEAIIPSHKTEKRFFVAIANDDGEIDVDTIFETYDVIRESIACYDLTTSIGITKQ